MDFLLSRYRNLSVLLLVILVQLLLLAYQVKSNQDVRLIRVWAVTAVTPLARALEFVREHTLGVAENYFVLVNVRNDNSRLKEELGRLKIENQFMRTELGTAERVRALSAFQQRTPSRTLAGRVIGTGTGANSRVVFIDRGSGSGVMRAMAVITPDGIVGKVLNSYPTASQVLLITDSTFAAGVISDKNRVHGTVKGIGQSKVIVDYVQNEEKVEVGETFFTSGDDRIFPKGMPVGKVTVVRPGKTFKEIFLVPAGFQQGLEEVLIVIEGVHGTIPDLRTSTVSPGIYVMPTLEKAKPEPGPQPPAAGPQGTDPAKRADAGSSDVPGGGANLATDADKVREQYRKLGESQGIKFGERGKIPNFNAAPAAPAPPSATPKPEGTAPKIPNTAAPGTSVPSTSVPKIRPPVPPQ